MRSAPTSPGATCGLAALKAERDAIFKMARSRRIGSATARKLVHELDLQELRYKV